MNSDRSFNKSLNRTTNSQAKASRGMLEPEEVVKRMIQCDEEKTRQLRDIESKPKMLLSEEELKLQQNLLMEQLKTVNQNLNRIVNKELAAQQADANNDLKRGNGKNKMTAQDEIDHEVQVLESQIANHKQRRKLLKQEY